MSELEQKYYYFVTKAAFDLALTNGTLTNDKIAFIKETKQIWTHGQLYDCKEAVSESTVSEWGFAKSSDLQTKAEDSSVVHKAGNETITGAKTFNSVVNFLGSGDYNAVTIGANTRFNVNGSLYTVLGFIDGDFYLNYNAYNLLLRGKAARPTYNNADMALVSDVSGKQDAISDLATIRSGASKGATAVQPNTLAKVATSGSYNDLANKPYIGSNIRLLTGSGYDEITTAQFITKLTDLGLFTQRFGVVRASFEYGYNDRITDSGIEIIPLYGAVVEVFGQTSYYTIRVTTSSMVLSGHGSPKHQYMYFYNGDNYSPGWVKVANSTDLANYLPISGGTVNNQVKFRHGANRTTPQIVIGGDSNNAIATLEFDTPDGASAWQFSMRGQSTANKELMLYRGANWAQQWRIDYATGKMIQYGDLEIRGKISANSGLGATTPIVNVTTTSQALSPNKMYVWSKAPTSLTLTLVAPADNSIVNEYIAEFPVYNTTVTLPAGVVWGNNNAPQFNNGSVLQLSIVNNKGTWTEFKNVYSPPTYSVAGTFYKQGTSGGNTVYYSSGAGIATITINGYDTFTVYVRHSNGYNDNLENEGEYDYMVVGNLDATITASSVTGSAGVKYTTQGNDTPESTVDAYDITQYQAVTFSGIGGGRHTIMISYHKDSQFNIGEDRGYILIPE